MSDIEHFEFDRVELFRSYPSIKQHILFYSNGVAIWHGLPDMRHPVQVYQSCLWQIICHFEFDQVEIFQSSTLIETTQFVSW